MSRKGKRSRARAGPGSRAPTCSSSTRSTWPRMSAPTWASWSATRAGSAARGRSCSRISARARASTRSWHGSARTCCSRCRSDVRARARRARRRPVAARRAARRAPRARLLARGEAWRFALLDSALSGRDARGWLLHDRLRLRDGAPGPGLGLAEDRPYVATVAVIGDAGLAAFVDDVAALGGDDAEVGAGLLS